MAEKFDFTAGLKKKLTIAAIVGVVLVVLGSILSGSGHHEEGGHDDAHATEVAHDTHKVNDHHAKADDHGKDHHGDEAHHEATAGGHGDDHHEAGHEKGWFSRLKADLWINNVYFAGLAIIGVFFFAIQYAAQAGWSASIVRIPLSMASWLPIAGVLMLVLFFFVKGDIFHWTHADLYDTESSHYDHLIDGKKGFFFGPGMKGGGFPVFYIIRMVAFFGVWIWLFKKLKNLSLQEDSLGGNDYWRKMRSLSAIFLVIFAVTSSVSAWDWVMSIDTHWFSTMFGWYVFASWWVSGLAFITLVVVLLKEAGYLPQVNANHLHDLGKFVFAFSIFWTYIWFSQFLLIYYANIPEESVYFVERLLSDKYAPFFFVNLIMNFFFPFLTLMTRDAKRLMVFLKIVCVVVLLGHWIDFYLMVTPGTMGQNGAFGLTEIGLYLIFGSAFVFVALKALSKNALVPQNHPMLEEAKHHHI